MRFAPLLPLLLAVGCHSAPRPTADDRVARVATMDSAMTRRLCESPDSVIAGRKDCVLLDQSRRPDPQRLRPAPRAP